MVPDVTRDTISAASTIYLFLAPFPVIVAIVLVEHVIDDVDREHARVRSIAI